jgi:hypothetical protein
VPDHGSAEPVVKTQSAAMSELDENGNHESVHYGGNDLDGPTLDKKSSLPPSEENHDPNVVTWDGPDDPANPKNWSGRYRWFITALCCITTLNVYASSCITSFSSSD